MDNKPFSVKDRLRSFRYAFKGVITLLANEHNARIHAVATLCVIIAGFIFDICAMEWVAVVISIGMVFAAEAFNTAVEYMADFISPGHNEYIGKAKDVAAGAVLILSVCAVVIALIIFIPKIELIIIHNS